MGLLIGWLAALQGPEECHGVTPYYIAVGGLLAAFFISFILEVAAAVISYRGSIFETQKRAALPTIIYVNALCYLTQVAFNSYASYLIVVDPPECSSSAGKVWDPVDVMDGVVYSTWAILIGKNYFMKKINYILSLNSFFLSIIHLEERKIFLFSSCGLIG